MTHGTFASASSSAAAIAGPLPGTSADGQPEGNSAPNVLEYLDIPQDRAGAYRAAACTIEVATRSVLLVIRLHLRFSVVLEP